MARVKVRLADQIARVVFIETDATNGATLDTNLFMADGKTVATPTLLRKYLGLSEDGGTTQHKLLSGLTKGDDHPQYTMWQARETIKGQWDFVSAIWGADGTVSLPEFTFTSDTDTGFFRIGDDNPGLSIGGALRWDVNDNRAFHTDIPMVVLREIPAAVSTRVGLQINGRHAASGQYCGVEAKIGTGLNPIAGDITTQLGIWEGGTATDGVVAYPPGVAGYGFRWYLYAEAGTAGDLIFYSHNNSSVGAEIYRHRKETAQMIFADGAAGLPTIAFGSNANTGLSYVPGVSSALVISHGGNARLSVRNLDIVSTAQIVGPAAAATGPTYSFSADSDTGVFRVGADTLGFSTGGTLRLSIVTNTAIESSLPWRGPNGGVGGPAYSFTGDTDTGMYSGGANILLFGTAGTQRFGLGAAGEILDSSGSAGSSGQVPVSGGSGAAWTWGAAGAASPLTTKGDLYTYSTTDDRLPVGTDGYVLIANSATATGLEWVAAGGGGAAPITSTFLTVDDETATLTNSRRLLAGTNVAFDDSTPGERTINVSSAGSGNMVYVGSAMVSGAAATDLTISGLDLDTDGCYFVAYEIKNGSGSTANIALYFNADTTATNYDTQQSNFSGTGNSNARANNANLYGITSGRAASSYFYLRKNFDGQPRAVVTSTLSDTTNIQTHITSHSWRTSGTNVTDITLRSSVASALSVGSVIHVWKVTT